MGMLYSRISILYGRIDVLYSSRRCIGVGCLNSSRHALTCGHKGCWNWWLKGRSHLAYSDVFLGSFGSGIRLAHSSIGSMGMICS